MIPADWEPRHREDGELVGYLVGDGALVVPMSRVGIPLGSASDRKVATALLDSTGLAALARTYYARLPNPVPVGGVDATDPQPGWNWRDVVIVESSPSRVSFRPRMAYPEELRALVVIEPPVGDVLLERQPE